MRTFSGVTRVISVMIVALALAGASASAQDAGESPMATARELLKLRDPFRIPNGLKKQAAENVPDLERFPVHDFKVLGIMTGPKNLRAMLRGPNGNTYFVTKDDRIGTREGVIQEITNEEVRVQEQIVNVLGEKEAIMTVLALPADARR